MVTPQEASRRRRIVYHAALNRLPNDMVNAAVRLCDREFQATPVFSVQKFLSRLTEAVGAPPKPGEFFAAMNRLRVVNDPDEIGPDPVSGGPAAATATKSPPPPPAAPVRTRPLSTPTLDLNIDSWPSAFGAVLSTLLVELNRIRPDLPAAAREGVALRLQKVDLGPHGYAELNAWAGEKSTTFTTKITMADMQTALHEFYVWVCEELGPIDADRLFGLVIRDVSLMPGAVQFPPRNLL